MKVSARAIPLLAVAGLLALATDLRAQSKPAPAFRPSPNLSDQERRGEFWFLQRCSICHLAKHEKEGPAAGPAFGPSLEGLFKGAPQDPEKEKVVRQFILKGTRNMPGWRYALGPKQFDDLIAYLKTL